MENKACISQMLHFCIDDGPGIRTTVFFQGCNLGCPWCHNPETIPAKGALLFYSKRCIGCGKCAQVCNNHVFINNTHTIDRSACDLCGRCVPDCPAEALYLSGTNKSTEQVMSFILQDIDFYQASGGGVTLSGGEPLLQAGFCAEIAKICRAYGISVIIDTAGKVDYGEFEKILPFTREFYFDLKEPKPNENLKRLVQDGAEVTARIPVIPGYNDSASAVMEYTVILKDAGVKKVNLLPFHRMGAVKYDALDLQYAYRDCDPPPMAKMEEISAILTAYFDIKKG